MTTNKKEEIHPLAYLTIALAILSFVLVIMFYRGFFSTRTAQFYRACYTLFPLPGITIISGMISRIKSNKMESKRSQSISDLGILLGFIVLGLNFLLIVLSLGTH